MTKPRVEIRCRAMTTLWPAQTAKGNRKLSKKWDATPDNCRAMLAAELGTMGVAEAMIEVDCPQESLSRVFDGWPKAGAAMASQRVAVWFEVAGTMRAMRCDAHRTWQFNLYAIALTLHRNRLIRDYGTASVEEQYGGFQALPEGNGGGPKAGGLVHPWNNVEDAARHLIDAAGLRPGTELVRDVIQNRQQRQSVHRQAAKRNHPDKQGGHIDAMMGVNSAKEFIDSFARSGG